VEEQPLADAEDDEQGEAVDLHLAQRPLPAGDQRH